MKVSSYAKRWLPSEAALDAARQAGLLCRMEPGPRGTLKLMARTSPGSGHILSTSACSIGTAQA
jgi:hypothetical protein